MPLMTAMMQPPMVCSADRTCARGQPGSACACACACAARRRTQENTAPMSVGRCARAPALSMWCCCCGCEAGARRRGRGRVCARRAPSVVDGPEGTRLAPRAPPARLLCAAPTRLSPEGRPGTASSSPADSPPPPPPLCMRRERIAAGSAPASHDVTAQAHRQWALAPPRSLRRHFAKQGAGLASAPPRPARFLRPPREGDAPRARPAGGAPWRHRVGPLTSAAPLPCFGGLPIGYGCGIQSRPGACVGGGGGGAAPRLPLNRLRSIGVCGDGGRSMSSSLASRGVDAMSYFFFMSTAALRRSKSTTMYMGYINRGHGAAVSKSMYE